MNAAQAPIWGNFVAHADDDVLAFAWLLQGGLHVKSYYHAIQAIEKYLKGLALSIEDPTGRTHPYPIHKRWLDDHNLARLARRCSKQFPYYGTAVVQATLERFSEFDQATRYPWVTQKLGNGFTSADVPVMVSFMHRLRNDIPIVLDDYSLGILVRGHHHNHPEHVVNQHWAALQAPALNAARRIIPNIDKMIRW
jgi:HEPN domain-containing protein